MADLSELHSTLPIRLAGGDPVTGTETFFANVDANGQQIVSDISNNGGANAAITVGITSLIANVSGTANLSNRKYLTVYNNGTAPVFWGVTAGVTIATGTPIAKGQLISWAVGPNTSIYLISTVAAQNIRITEMA